MNEGLLISGMALITFIIRYALFGVSGQITLSPKLLQLLRYVPPSVLSAIVVPTVLLPERNAGLLMNARLIGAIAAILTGYHTKNLFLTILVGMFTFLFWQWFISPH